MEEYYYVFHRHLADYPMQVDILIKGMTPSMLKEPAIQQVLIKKAVYLGCLRQDAERAHALWPPLIPNLSADVEDRENIRKYIYDVIDKLLHEILSRRRIFIGHGHSDAWLSLKNLLSDLKLDWDEFNRETAAGYTVTERLSDMLDHSCFAFIVMTAEDERNGHVTRARSNVIHEIGLFQGRLGFQRTIILLEDGCDRFSNVDGITYIGFPAGNISACFSEISRVLIREKFKVASQ